MQTGTAVDLYRRPVDLTAARFFCDFNEVDGVVRGGRADSRWACFPAPGVPDGPAVVCVRPQAIRLRAAGSACPAAFSRAGSSGRVDLLELAVQGVEARRCGRGCAAEGLQSPARTSGSTLIRTRFLFLPLRRPRFPHMTSRPAARRPVVLGSLAMGGVSIWHWIVVGIVVDAALRRGKVSELMGDVAKGIKAFKKGMTEERLRKRPSPSSR